MPRLEVALAWFFSFLPGILLFVAYIAVPRRHLAVVIGVFAILALGAGFVYFDSEPDDAFRINEAVGKLALMELAIAGGAGVLARWLLSRISRVKTQRN